MAERVLFVLAVIATLSGCGRKHPLEKIYAKELFYGQWQGKIISIAGNNNTPSTSVHSRVEDHGAIQCTISPADTYKFDIAIVNDVYGYDSRGTIDYGRVILNAGYRLSTAGRFVYQDSTASFYDYRNKQVLHGILYCSGDDMYLTFCDKNQNEWNVQFSRIN